MSIEYLIFDLDNTLYPSSAQMDKGITTRMMNCVAEFFNTSYEEAVKIRAEHITNFSTTLEWLRSEGLTDIETYFSKIHPGFRTDRLQMQRQYEHKRHKYPCFSQRPSYPLHC